MYGSKNFPIYINIYIYTVTVTLHRKKMNFAYNNSITYISSGFGALYRQRSVDKTICWIKITKKSSMNRIYIYTVYNCIYNRMKLVVKYTSASEHWGSQGQDIDMTSTPQKIQCVDHPSWHYFQFHILPVIHICYTFTTITQWVLINLYIYINMYTSWAARHSGFLPQKTTFMAWRFVWGI